MTRTEAIARINAALPELSDDRVRTLAEIVEAFASDDARPAENEETRAAVARGIEQGRRGEFATKSQVAAAYARFRK